MNLYILHMCNLLCVNYISIKLFKEPVVTEYLHNSSYRIEPNFYIMCTVPPNYRVNNIFQIYVHGIFANFGQY